MFTGCASNEYVAQARLLKLKTQYKEAYVLPGSCTIFFVVDNYRQLHYILFNANYYLKKSDVLSIYEKEMDYIIPYNQKIK